MRRTVLLGLVTPLSLLGHAGAQTAQNTPYFNDFETSVTAGWTSTRLSNTTALGRFMGDFGLSGGTQQSSALRLNVTPGLTYTLLFDFYGLRTPDGSNTQYGPDWFNVLVDGVRVFRESFDNKVFSDGSWGSAMQGTYVYNADRWGNLGFASSDGVFRKVTLTFVPAAATTTITFQGGFSQAIGDEAWGIDNVRVVASTSAAPFVPRFAEVSKLRTFAVRATTAANDAAGVNWTDVNNDGYLDCVVTGTTPRVFLYNSSTRKFTASTIVASGNFYRQCAVGDFDNDADADLFGMTSDSAETGLLGQGNGTFVTAGSLGFTAPSTNETVAAADVNADGWLDLLMFSGNGNHLATNGGTSRWPGTLGFGGSGTAAVPYVAPLTGVATPAGLNGVGNAGDGVYVASADVNDDGIPDFWYGFGGGRLFVSSSGGGYTASTAIASDVSNSNKIGAAFGDFDNDGKVDLFVPAFAAGSRGKLYRGLGNGTFTDVSLASGIADASGHRSCCWGDYDNDGDLDLYIVTRAGVGNRLYRNNNDGTFTLVDERCAAESADALDACFADYDNDGDLDLAVSVNNNTTRLYDNALDTISATKNYLKVRFVGSGSGATNVQGVGQRLFLLDSSGRIIARRELGNARGIGTEPVIAHFGGVDPTQKYFVRVISKGKAYSTAVTPGTVSTKIGSNTFQQMLTITESALKPPLRITSWTEDTQ